MRRFALPVAVTAPRFVLSGNCRDEERPGYVDRASGWSNKELAKDN